MPGVRRPAARRPGNAAPRLQSAIGNRQSAIENAFTLIEVLAAMMFMAIVIPVAVEALHVASVSGEVAVRRAAAMRIADAVLNENIATTNWTSFASGTVVQGGSPYRWSLRNQTWPADPNLQLITAEVDFSVQDRSYSVSLNTLAQPLTLTTTTTQ